MPDGFVVTAAAYQQAMTDRGVREDLKPRSPPTLPELEALRVTPDAERFENGPERLRRRAAWW